MEAHTRTGLSGLPLTEKLFHKCGNAAEQGDVAVGDEKSKGAGATRLVPEEVNFAREGEDVIVQEQRWKTNELATIRRW